MTSPLEALRAQLRNVPLAVYLYHRLRQWTRPFRPIARTPYGFRMTGNAAMEAGAFEAEEVALVRSLLDGCDVLIDAGANVGLYACLARSLGRAAIAVEPDRANLRALRANLAANGWEDTEVVAAGLAEASGQAQLYGADTGASMVPGWGGLSPRTLECQSIALTTLDEVLKERFRGERLMVKIDVEGAEHALLRGASRTLERTPAPVWIVEICLTENFPHGVNPDYVATFEAFFARGYRAWTANSARAPVTREDVARWAAQRRAGSGAHNYLFMR